MSLFTQFYTNIFYDDSCLTICLQSVKGNSEEHVSSSKHTVPLYHLTPPCPQIHLIFRVIKSHAWFSCQTDQPSVGMFNDWFGPWASEKKTGLIKSVPTICQGTKFPYLWTNTEATSGLLNPFCHGLSAIDEMPGSTLPLQVAGDSMQCKSWLHLHHQCLPQIIPGWQREVLCNSFNTISLADLSWLKWTGPTHLSLLFTLAGIQQKKLLIKQISNLVLQKDRILFVCLFVSRQYIQGIRQHLNSAKMLPLSLTWKGVVS